MSSKSEATDALRKYLRELDTRINALTNERNEVEGALGTISGRPNGPAPRAPRGPNRRKRQPMDYYDRIILDHLRMHSNVRFSPVELAKALDAPPGTLRQRIKVLVAEGKVEQTGETARGNAMIRHKPIGVKPGEQVTQ